MSAPLSSALTVVPTRNQHASADERMNGNAEGGSAWGSSYGDVWRSRLR